MLNVPALRADKHWQAVQCGGHVMYVIFVIIQNVSCSLPIILHCRQQLLWLAMYFEPAQTTFGWSHTEGIAAAALHDVCKSREMLQCSRDCNHCYQRRPSGKSLNYSSGREWRSSHLLERQSFGLMTESAELPHVKPDDEYSFWTWRSHCGDDEEIYLLGYITM